MNFTGKKILYFKLFLAGICFSAQSTAINFNIQEPDNSTIRKSVFFMTTPTSVETLFYVGNNRFVTTFHAVSNNQEGLLTYDKAISEIFFLNYQGESLPFKKIVALDFLNDLAVLELEKEVFKEIEKELIPLEIIPSSQVPQRAKFFAYGFSTSFTQGLLLQKATSKGYIKIKSEQNPNQIFTYINSKNGIELSGGPVTFNGKVFAVIHSGLDNQLVASSSEVLIELLKKSQLKGDTLSSMFSEFERAINSFENGDKSLYATLNALRISSSYQSNVLEIIEHHVKANNVKKATQLLEEFLLDRNIDLENYLFANAYRDTDESRAIELYKKSATNGLAASLRALAKLYGEKGDKKTAIRYYKRAALSGDRSASYLMGLFEKHNGNKKIARQWFEISFSQKFTPAIKELPKFQIIKKIISRLIKHVTKDSHSDSFSNIDLDQGIDIDSDTMEAIKKEYKNLILMKKIETVFSCHELFFLK